MLLKKNKENKYPNEKGIHFCSNDLTYICDINITEIAVLLCSWLRNKHKTYNPPCFSQFYEIFRNKKIWSHPNRYSLCLLTKTPRTCMHACSPQCVYPKSLTHLTNMLYDKLSRSLSMPFLNQYETVNADYNLSFQTMVFELLTKFFFCIKV